MTDSDRLDAAFAALAHPARRAILARLARQEATVNELAEPFDMTLPAISKHIRVLEDAGLITKARRAQFRPCVLKPETLAAVAGWTEQYRPIWEARFDAFDKVLNEMKGSPNE
ncbi:MAG: ArsR/SmtB family transcription factor [Rhizobiaceae bacterium]